MIIVRMEKSINCPVCTREFMADEIEDHVNKCLFLNTNTQVVNNNKRNGSPLPITNISPREKRMKIDNNISSSSKEANLKHTKQVKSSATSQRSQNNDGVVPLAERMRPQHLDEIVGHKEAFGSGSMLRSMLEQGKIPNMILYGPPGCGKTSLGNTIATICKEHQHLRFVKLCATTAGINSVKLEVTKAQNELKLFKNMQTILFMDEIHRFDKRQQDTFLTHVENGTIVLVGATTENPSFSLNNTLLSRCKVVVMQKLSTDDVQIILERAIEKNENLVISDSKINVEPCDNIKSKCMVERASLNWLAEICDGDARVALGALEMAVAAQNTSCPTNPRLLTLGDFKNGIKRSHIFYDRRGEEHYNTISALQKSIRAGDDNAALYWTARALHGGEDPLYVARRLVRTASEDIGLADPNAIVEAVACLQGCQNIGMPECDVLLAQCAVRLARAPKSRAVYLAMKRCQRTLAETKGPLPPIPLHLRNAPTKLMKNMGYGAGYNTLHRDESGLKYMPDNMEDVDFFQTCTSD